MRAFTVIDAPQRSPEWFAARVGRLTSSCADDMLAEIKKGESAGRRNLRVRLVLERLTGRTQESGYVSAAMQQGIDREPDAYVAYQAITGELLTRTGFLQHDTLLAGGSLDGHFGDFERIVEIKCPTPAIHLSYLRTGVVPLEYQRQVNHLLWLTGAKACDWLTFNPDFPHSMRAKLVEIRRDEEAIEQYDRAARAFLDEVDREFEAICTLNNLREQLTAAVTA